MSGPEAESRGTADPLETWRAIRDAYMDIWAKTMTETVNTEAYSKATGAMLETFLTSSAPFRDVQKKMMLSTLEQLNMPSRADFVSLAERLTNIELLLDDMAARLSQIHQLAINAATQSSPEAQPKPEESKSELSRVEPETEPAARKSSAKAAKKRSK